MKEHTVCFEEDGLEYKLVVEYGFTEDWVECIFAINCKLGVDSKSPQYVDCKYYIHKYAPELEYLVKWHRCSKEGPVYYYVDAYFEWNSCFDLSYFKEKVVYGVSKLDTLDFDRDYSKEEFEEWERARLPEVTEAFRKDMERAGLM